MKSKCYCNQGSHNSSSHMTGLLEFLVDLSTDNSHGFQLSLFALIGRLELPHPLCQVVFLHLLPLPELPAPEPGLAVRRQQPQPQLLDARLNSCHKTESPAELFPRHLVIMDFTLSQTLTFKNPEATLKKMKRVMMRPFYDEEITEGRKMMSQYLESIPASSFYLTRLSQSFCQHTL